MGKRESLADVSSDELFRRLFWQKNDESEFLLRIAQVCALVYSFDGENDQTELPRLAALAGTSVLDVYRTVDALLKRGVGSTSRSVARNPTARDSQSTRKAGTLCNSLPIHRQSVGGGARATASVVLPADRLPARQP